MAYLLGACVVVAVLAFVVLPLVRRQRPGSPVLEAVNSAHERAAIYRELLELELDQKVGKIAEADFRELNDTLLARAAALIAREDSLSAAADAEIEREIAEARAALREERPDSTQPISAPSEESRA